MQHKVKITVIDKKLYPDLQEQFCADPHSGLCPCYNIGDEYIFERYKKADDFWNIGIRTLNTSKNHLQHQAGSNDFPHCSEAWDAISRYIYTGLQGGSIMRGWMNDERVMIACCSDGTRPVIFKIERLDYKVLYIEGIGCEKCEQKISAALKTIPEIKNIVFRHEDNFTEVYLDKDISDEVLRQTIENCGNYSINKID